ncbi:MAG: NAD-glutamate dehydrogenase, partial [Actinomycetota bacterium]|nr:NAD-glutamate dehydrogenase [Actinomycetota bacterium]
MGVGFAEWYSWSSARDERLAGHFYRYVDPSDLAGRGPEAVVGAVTHVIDTARRRAQDEAVVRVVNPTVAVNRWTCGRTVVSIVTDDMPFLVDSVSAELNRLGIGIHLVVHPIMAVSRDETGRLLQADPPGTGLDSASAALPGAGRVAGHESWMHIEVAWQPDEAALAAIEENLHRILNDVRRA